MNRKKESAAVLAAERLAEDIVRMRLGTESARTARPGQFINLYLRDGAHLLPRPISICEIDRNKGELTIVFRIVGAGTRVLAALGEGETVDIIGPLGNGFFSEGTDTAKKALFIGGGIGIPPMLAAAKAWQGEGAIVLGFRDGAFLTEDFEAVGYPVYVSSDSGSVGRKGTVIDVLDAEDIACDICFACGPKPMLRAVRDYAIRKHLPAYLSMEERMACGIGVCLGCVCDSVHTDDHSMVHNKRVCTDGPVFEAREIIL